MTSISAVTLGDALEQHRRANGIDPDAALATTWGCKFACFELKLPNFSWRKAAILRHDLHHVLTGFPCTIRGECQMAAWEFAAGRFPDCRATLFCLPLVALGVILVPSKTFDAFVLGRNSRSLYGRDLDMKELVASAQSSNLPTSIPSAKTQDRFAFLALLTASSLEIALPMACVLSLG